MLIPLFHYFRFEAEAFYRAHFERYASLARNSLLSSHYAAAAASSNPAAALSALVLSMSNYPESIHVHLSGFYSNFFQVLFGFCSSFVQILSSFCPDFVQFLSRFRQVLIQILSGFCRDFVQILSRFNILIFVIQIWPKKLWDVKKNIWDFHIKKNGQTGQ